MAAGNHTDPLVTEAYQLTRDYIAYVTGRSTGPAPSAAARTLRQAGDELLDRFPIFFKRWPRVFQGLTEEEACDYLIQTIDENIREYRERQTRHPGYPEDIPWSTILSIYVLSGQMAIYCQEHGMENVIEPLTERVGTYIEEHVCPLLRNKNGWVGFIEYFGKKEDIERKTFRICCTVLAVFSALILTYLLWRKKLSFFPS
ncbi:bcl-2-like protein 1 [Dendropsophus ebraccatus]|uniref:bcl-2-like protein 1 n=1 Tax=Dendropsophus ebraccatus TaxID=150705 RepID=UPI003831ABA6